MRKIVFALLAVFAATTAFAQETYSVDATVQQVADLTAIINARNERLCYKVTAGAAFTCTQAAACTFFNAPGGASCTATQARSVGARVYPNANATDRTEYVKFNMAGPQFTDQKAILPSWSQFKACLKWQTDNQTARDSSCSAAGLGAGCTLYPSSCS